MGLIKKWVSVLFIVFVIDGFVSALLQWLGTGEYFTKGVLILGSIFMLWIANNLIQSSEEGY